MLLEGNAVRGLNVGLKMQNLKKEQEGAAHKGNRCPLTPPLREDMRGGVASVRGRGGGGGG